MASSGQPRGAYEILGKIGEGAYGVVYLLRYYDRKRSKVAVKTFKASKEGEGVSPTAIREMMLLSELRHENVVRLHNVYVSHGSESTVHHAELTTQGAEVAAGQQSESALSLAFEYAEYDLNEIVRFHRLLSGDHGGERGVGVSERVLMPGQTVKSIMWQLLNGLHYLHSNWVIHRDLKPSNILVVGKGDQQGVVKIADFGLARIFQDPLRNLTDNGVVVTIWYRAPELLLGAKHYTRAVDMWAVGCIFGELLTLKPLFQGLEDKSGSNPFQYDQLEKIFTALGTPTTSNWPTLDQHPHWQANLKGIREVQRPQDLKAWGGSWGMAHADAQPGSPAFDLLTGLLAYDPAARLTAHQALQHPYFNEHHPPKLIRNSLAPYKEAEWDHHLRPHQGSNSQGSASAATTFSILPIRPIVTTPTNPPLGDHPPLFVGQVEEELQALPPPPPLPSRTHNPTRGDHRDKNGARPPRDHFPYNSKQRRESTDRRNPNRNFDRKRSRNAPESMYPSSDRR